jgi:MFS transporter, PPP family, 3-phenylpropionic acid transporter
MKLYSIVIGQLQNLFQKVIKVSKEGITMAVFKIRFFNFSYFSLFAIFLSFLPVYLTTKDIPESKIGIIVGVGGFIGILSQPLLGIISDKWKTIKMVLLLILGISVGAGFLLFQSSTTFTLVLLVGVMYFFFIPSDPLVESLNFQTAQQYRVNYGSIRMYGALGYAITSFIIGYITNRLGMSSLAYLFLAYGIITLLFCFRIDDVQPNNKPLRFIELKKFISQKTTLSFFLLVFIIALPHRINDMFIGIYIHKLGGDYQLVGNTWFIMTIIEVFFFAIVHRFLKSGNELKLISISGLFYAIRFFLTSVTDSPYIIVFLQLLQGITFVFFYSSAIQYLYSIIPVEWKATGQTILAVLFFGISGIIGSIVGGLILEKLGGSSLYKIMALLSLAGVALSIVIQKKK